MKSTTSVILVGVGGQGILLASTIIARAAMHAGHRVKTNEVHGMAQRGGSVIAQVRYGPEVHSPLVPEGSAKVLASLERIEALRYAQYLAPEGLAVVNMQPVIPVTVSMGAARYPDDAEARLRRVFDRLVCFDAASIARDLGNARAANVVVVGALSNALDLPEDAWRAALAGSVPGRHRDVNTEAFLAGRSCRS